MSNIKSLMDRERTRLTKVKQDLTTQLTKVDTELKAIDAYLGRGPAPGRGKQDQVVSFIKGSAGGLTRAEIIQKMGVKGNKSGEQSISNALGALKRSKRLVLKGGKYNAL